MSVLFSSACETLADWDQVTSNMFVSAGGGLSGNGIGSNVAGYGSPWLSKYVSIGGSHNALTVHYWQWIPAGALPFPGASVYIVGGIYGTGGAPFSFGLRQLSINCTQTGVLYFALGGYTGPILGTATAGWVAGQWNEVEYSVVISHTVGSIDLAVNGATVLTLSGIDTQALSTSLLDGIEVVPQSIAGSAAIIDDVTFDGIAPVVGTTGGVLDVTLDPLTLAATIESDLGPGIWIQDPGGTWVNRTQESLYRSVRISYGLGQRGECDVEVLDQDSFETAYRPGVSENIKVVGPSTFVGAASDILFSGAILSVEDGPLGAPGVGTVTRINAVDVWAGAGQRRVTKTYPAGLTLHAIVQDLVSTYLAIGHFTLDPTMPAGPVVGTALTFDLVTLEDAFNQLVDATSWVYRMLPGRVIEWFPIGARERTFTLSAANHNIIGPVTWTKTKGSFANRIILRYGTGLVGRYDLWYGDGTTTRFSLSYPPTWAAPDPDGWIGWMTYIGGPYPGPATPPTPPVGGGHEAIGNSPTNKFGGFPWYWDVNTHEIVRNVGADIPNWSGGTVAAAPLTGHYFFAEYNVQYPLTVIAETAEALEFPVESVVERADIFDTAQAQAVANSLLAKVTDAPRTVTLKTRIAENIQPGDTIPLDVPARTLPSAIWMVIGVTMISDLDAIFTTTLELLEGSTKQATWLDFWRDLLGTGAGAGISSGSNSPGPPVAGGTGAGGVSAFGELTANQLVIGQGGATIAALGSSGSPTTVLHGGLPPTYGPVDLAADVTGILPLANLPDLSVPGAALNTFLVQGGQVVWISAYTFRVSAASYYIAGVAYTSLEQTITLDAAHASLDRIDVIGVDTTSTVFKETGTPAAQPSEPDIDLGLQLKLALVLVPAATAAPPTVSNQTIYLENVGAPTEWNWSISGSGYSLASTTAPRTGTKAIEGTNVINGPYVEAQIGTGTLDLAAYARLVLYVRSKATWANNRGIQINFRAAGVRVGNQVAINRTGTWGFDSSITTAYQQVAIPMSTFAVPAGTLVNQLRVASFGGAIGFYVDDIVLQADTSTQQGGLTQAQADARYRQLSVPLVLSAPADIVGNLPVTNLNSGTGATSASFWRGDGTWGAVPGSAEFDAGTSGASKTIDWNNGVQQLCTLTASCTFTLTNPVAGRAYRLILIENGTGGWTPTFPSTVKWENNVAPTWVTTANNVIFVSLVYTGLGADGYLGFATLLPITSP
jgi:hypothetical protein